MAASNYSLYIKERLGEEIIEDDRGFITYQFENNVVWIRDMFVRKEFRGQKIAREYFEKIKSLASDNRINRIQTHVCIKSTGWNLSFDMLIKEGFKVNRAEESLIILTLDI